MIARNELYYSILTCSGPSRSYRYTNLFRQLRVSTLLFHNLERGDLWNNFLTCYVQEPTDVFFHQMEQRSLSRQRLYPTKVLWRSSFSWRIFTPWIWPDLPGNESKNYLKCALRGNWMQLAQFPPPPPKKKNFIKAFQTASASSDRTRHLFAPVQLVTRGASLLAVDGSTDLSAHGFRSSGVRNVAIDQLLLSIAMVEVESVGWHMVTRFSSASTYFYLHISIHHYTSFNSMDKAWKILRVSSWTCFIHLKGPCIPCTVIPRLSTIIDYPNPSPPKFCNPSVNMLQGLCNVCFGLPFPRDGKEVEMAPICSRCICIYRIYIYIYISCNVFAYTFDECCKDIYIYICLPVLAWHLRHFGTQGISGYGFVPSCAQRFGQHPRRWSPSGSATSSCGP